LPNVVRQSNTKVVITNNGNDHQTRDNHHDDDKGLKVYAFVICNAEERVMNNVKTGQDGLLLKVGCGVMALRKVFTVYSFGGDSISGSSLTIRWLIKQKPK